jgi:hypothetical protein
MLYLLHGGDAMNPIPPGVTPSIPIPVNASLEVLLLLTVVSLLIIFVMALREFRGAYRRRERLLCPVRLRRVRVLFRLWPDGEPADVLRCSVFGRRPITCGKVCLDRGARA